LRVLMLGDGAGNDSIFLAQTGINVDFFEVPFSRTYDFALKRFASRDLLGGRIRVLESYADCLSGQYDVVISFEVLEHLPDPPAAIRDLSVMLKEGGIALITEAFSYLADNLPTHLEANRQYAGRTPFLFLRNGMLLRWYSPDPLFKPMEFVKQQRPELKNFFSLVSDATVTRLWISERRCNFKKQAKSLFRG
jgi:SAM-dependent methyltransferase